QEMADMGAVNEVVDHAELETAALTMAKEILGKSPNAQRMLKFAFNLVDDGLMGQQVFAGEATRLGYMTDEAVEGRDACLDKRGPAGSPSPVCCCRAGPDPSCPRASSAPRTCPRRSTERFRDTRSSSCPQTARVPSPRRPRVRGQAPERVRLSSSSPPAPPGRRRLWPCPPAP